MGGCFSCCCLRRELKIGSFNLQKFGQAKSKNKRVLDILAKVIQEFDIILLIEINDASERAVKELLENVNNGFEESEKYEMVLSPRLGEVHSRYREQYAFIFKKSKIKVKKMEIYPDKENVYPRDPMAIQFKSKRFVINV